MKTQRFIFLVLLLSPGIPFAADSNEQGSLFTKLDRSTVWGLSRKIHLKFNAHHPQGMVKVGENFYVSSVEVTQEPKRLLKNENGPDRTAGEGIGHLFNVNSNGELVREVTLGKGTVYHPGGIDFDGRHIWVPVAEYRPNSVSIIYKIDLTTFKPEEVFQVSDHIGGVIYDTGKKKIHGMNWGSRLFYTWDGTGAEISRRPNPNHYIDYQHCLSWKADTMLCGGIGRFHHPVTGDLILGGIDRIDLATGRIIHQLPVILYTQTREVMTRNAWTVEQKGNSLRFWFLPEDGRGTIYEYEAVPGGVL